MINLESLQIFSDVLETQSFSRAAERNFITQSAVSQRMSNLEKEYGQKLLERGQGRGLMVPTEAGLILLEGAKRVLREASILEIQMSEITDEPIGTLRVATVYSVGLHALPPVLKPFLAAHPQINVHLEYKQTEQVYIDIINDKVDIGFVACPVAKRGLEVLPFGEEEMVLICVPEHPLAQFNELRLKQLDGVPFIGFDKDVPTRKLIEGRLQSAGAKVRQVTTFDNIETIKSLVEIGNGVSIVPVETVRQEVREGALVAIPFVTQDAFVRATGILLKKTSTRRASVRVFAEAMSHRKLDEVLTAAE